MATALYAVAIASGQPKGPLGTYLRKPGFHWRCEHFAHLDLYSSSDLPPATAATIGRSAEETLAAELRWAGATQYAPHIHIFLLESAESLRRLVGAYGFGASQPEEHIVCFVRGHPETLTHELNHEVMTSAPDAVDGQFRQLLANHKSFPLRLMVNAQWQASLPAFPSTAIYPELGSFVKYLRGTFGMTRLRQLWHGGSVAIPRILGKSQEELERDWQASLSRH